MKQRDEQDLARLGALGRELEGEVLSSVDTLERRRLLAALDRPGRRKLDWRVPALAAMVAAAAILVLVFWPAAALDYEVSGATVQRGFVEATADTTVSFSDGTTLILRSGGMARVADVTEVGARIHVERGRAELSVTPRPGAAWAVSAGPYEVRVTGTQFTVDWSPASRRFSVALSEGEVVVEGPLLGDGLVLRPGQTLEAVPGDVRVRSSRDLAASTASTPTAAPSTAPVASPDTADSAAPADSAEPAASSSPEPGAPTTEPVSWAQLLAEGKHDEVMRRARARGIGSVLASGSPGELTALGDAARYTGDGATARKALEQLRARFSGQPAAKTAAFLLGRMSEGSPAAAIRYYDLYLSESPGGAYAAEAEGRKLVLSQGSPAGVALARAYLRKYPKGPYAPLARQLTSAR